ncbi:hypothetical protein CR513_56402, partial [Mucuna pruriens]
MHILDKKKEWAKLGLVQIIDMLKNYYTMIFSSKDDHKHALFEDLRMIADHYLLLYNEHFLWRVWPKLGMMLKVNARFYVKVHFSKKLVPYIMVRGAKLNLKNKRLHEFCFRCGHYGHKKENCMKYGVSKDSIQNHEQGKSIAAIDRRIQLEPQVRAFGAFGMNRCGSDIADDMECVGVIIGDFNSIMIMEERKGRDYKLIDVSFHGFPLYLVDRYFIRETRQDVDKLLVGACVYHLALLKLDHIPSSQLGFKVTQEEIGARGYSNSLWLGLIRLLLEEPSMIKSRSKWLTYIDRNTKYFHGTTLIRRMKKTYESLQREDGT